MKRIVSFLPAGTEIVSALGAGAELVGRSHECDFPPGVETLPVVSRPSLALEGLTAEETDRAVAEQVASGASMYLIDEALLRRLEPDVILTQDLCKVCAPSGNELSRAVRNFERVPEILFLTPHTIAEIEQNVLDVGRALGRGDAANTVVRANRDKLARIRDAVSGAPPRRVVFLEWTDPLFCAGHWVPEMLAIAGGEDPLGRPGADSVRITLDEVRAARPEVVIVSPCGYRLEQAEELARALPDLGAAEVYAVDANAYFARPGPRIAEAVALLAHLLHPDRVGPPAPAPWLVPDDGRGSRPPTSSFSSVIPGRAR